MYCSVDGCKRQRAGRGWCIVHYSRWKRTGDPLMIKRPPSPIRLWLQSLEPGVATMLPDGLDRPDRRNAVYSAAAAAFLRVRVNTDLYGRFWVMVIDD